MTHELVITREARAQLDRIYDYITIASSHDIALRFTQAILDHIATLADLPLIGTRRDDLRPGLRTLAHRRRVTIAFMVEATAVVVIGIYYRGLDFERMLREEDD